MTITLLKMLLLITIATPLEGFLEFENMLQIQNFRKSVILLRKDGLFKLASDTKMMSGSPCNKEKSLLRVLLKVRSLKLRLLTFCASIVLPRKKLI